LSRELVQKYAPYTDELFKEESRKELLTNSDFDWTGAHSVAVWKISTTEMQDYARNVLPGEEGESTVANISRYGKLFDLDSQLEELLLKKDRSFIFNVDKLDEEESEGQLKGASALARELREVAIPEIDTYTYGVMVDGAGTKAEAVALTIENVYDLIADGTETLDDAEVPETDRVLVVTPTTHKLLKKAKVFDNTEIGAEAKKNGVVAEIDGMKVVKVPANRLPEKFGFMIAHPSATVAPVKLEDYGLHNDTPLSSGTIVTGRICYDAFVLDNKKAGIYYQPIA